MPPKEKLEIVIGAAPPPFRIFAGGFPRRRRRRNAFELIQEYSTKELALRASSEPQPNSLSKELTLSLSKGCG